MHSSDNKTKPARTAVGEDLWNMVRDSRPDILINAVCNRNLTEEMAVHIAKRSNVPSEVLGLLAVDVRFKTSYKLKLTICKNPKASLKVILSLLKFLRIFDLGDITKNQNIPVNIRKKIEYILLERAASLPSGIKIALAKRSCVPVILALLEKGDKDVVHSCLESPMLTEENICRVIDKPGVGPVLVRLISSDAKWSLRYRVRYCLARNYHTPMQKVMEFIGGLKTADLRELYSDKALPSSTRPYVYHELKTRNEPLERPRLKRYNLSEDEDADFAEIDLLN